MFFLFSPFSRGEGRDEGRRQLPTFAYAAAPHVVLKARLWRDPSHRKGGERGFSASPTNGRKCLRMLSSGRSFVMKTIRDR